MGDLSISPRKAHIALATSRKLTVYRCFAAPFFLSCAPSTKRPDTRTRDRRKNEMPIGTVKFFNEQKGYGFIQPESGGQDAFVHISAVERSGMQTLRQDQRVSYDLQQDNRGKMAAVNLKSADDAASAEPADDAEAGQAE